MSPKNKTLSLTVLSTILALMLLALGAYSYNDYRQDQLLEKEMADEKIAMEKELAELASKYDGVQALNSVMDSHLIEAKQRIVGLLDTIKLKEPKLQLLIKFRRDIELLKSERILLFKLNDSLERENNRMKVTLDQSEIALSKSKELRKILIAQNNQLVSLVSKSKDLSFTNITGEGLRVRNSGKTSPTSKASRTDRIQVCFLIKDNPLTLKGHKDIYLNIYNPNKVLIGDLVEISHEGQRVSYSAKEQVFYTNQQINVCISLQANSPKLLPGRYTIELFEDHKLIGNSRFILE